MHRGDPPIPMLPAGRRTQQDEPRVWRSIMVMGTERGEQQLDWCEDLARLCGVRGLVWRDLQPWERVCLLLEGDPSAMERFESQLGEHADRWGAEVVVSRSRLPDAFLPAPPRRLPTNPW